MKNGFEVFLMLVGAMTLCCSGLILILVFFTEAKYQWKTIMWRRRKVTPHHIGHLVSVDQDDLGRKIRGMIDEDVQEIMRKVTIIGNSIGSPQGIQKAFEDRDHMEEIEEMRRDFD